MAKFHYTNFLGGIQTATTPFTTADNELAAGSNVVTSYKLGAVMKRLGYSQIGSALQATKSITGLHNFRQNASTQKMLATVNDADGDDDSQLLYYTNVDTTVDVQSASGQKVVSVTSTTGFIAGDIIVLDKGGGNKETLTIDTISAGVSITVTENLTNTHAVGVTVEQDWTAIAAAETAWNGKEDINVEMEDFIGYCFFVGHGATDGFLPVASLTGTTFSTSTNVTDMPQGKFIKRYRDRLYVANLYDGSALPYRVGFSDLPSGGTLAWTEYQADTGLLDVDYSEAITGLGENWDKLLIFTEYNCYAYNQNEKKKIWDIGCSNHRTIRNSGAYMIWANRDGVWVSTGGRPNNIAGKIIDFIKYGNATNFFAEVVDEEYYLYVGSSVTVNGTTYSNVRLVYNIPTKSWRIEETADTPTVFAKFYSSGDDQLYIGDDDGEVMVQSKYTDTSPVYADDGTDIHSFFQSKIFDMGDPSVEKEIDKVMAYANRAQGLNLKARVVDNNTRAMTEFKSLGQLTKYVNEFTVNPDKGHLIQFEGVEVGQLPYWSFYGVTLDIQEGTKLT